MGLAELGGRHHQRIGGPVVAASAYLMKSPPKLLPDDIARAQLEDFIEG